MEEEIRACIGPGIGIWLEVWSWAPVLPPGRWLLDSCGMRWPAAGQPVSLWTGSPFSLLTSSLCTYDRVLAADGAPCSHDIIDFFESCGAEGSKNTPSATLRSHHASLGMLWVTIFKDSHAKSCCEGLDLRLLPGRSLTTRRTEA